MLQPYVALKSSDFSHDGISLSIRIPLLLRKEMNYDV